MFWDLWVGYSVVSLDQCESEFYLTVWITSIQACVEFGIPLIIIVFCNVRLLIYIK